MKWINCLLLLRLAFFALLLLIYFLFCYISLKVGGGADVLSFIRHVVLVTGLVPLLAWLILIFFAVPPIFIRLVIFVVVLMVYHYFLFAVSAHYDGLYYWSVQLGEVLIFLLMVRVVRARAEAERNT
ncbi:hypothetical protein ACIPM0_18665 [Pseudomonas sichuanensis]|uniref:hypothetical protein n=1 Tax=Pseudomonas TaxID=286 RepID=UPI00381C4329